MTGTYLLKRIGIGSAFKIGAVLGFVLSAIVLLPLGLLMALGVVNADDSSVAVAGATFGVVTMLCGPLVYAFIYGVLAALNAAIFNIIARVAGGLEIRLERSSSVAPLDVEEVVKNLTEFQQPARPTLAATQDQPQGEPTSQQTPSVDDVW